MKNEFCENSDKQPGNATGNQLQNSPIARILMETVPVLKETKAALCIGVAAANIGEQLAAGAAKEAWEHPLKTAVEAGAGVAAAADAGIALVVGAIGGAAAGTYYATKDGVGSTASAVKEAAVGAAKAVGPALSALEIVAKGDDRDPRLASAEEAVQGLGEGVLPMGTALLGGGVAPLAGEAVDAGAAALGDAAMAIGRASFPTVGAQFQPVLVTGAEQTVTAAAATVTPANMSVAMMAGEGASAAAARIPSGQVRLPDHDRHEFLYGRTGRDVVPGAQRIGVPAETRVRDAFEAARRLLDAGGKSEGRLGAMNVSRAPDGAITLDFQEPSELAGATATMRPGSPEIKWSIKDEQSSTGAAPELPQLPLPASEIERANAARLEGNLRNAENQVDSGDSHVTAMDPSQAQEASIKGALRAASDDARGNARVIKGADGYFHLTIDDLPGMRVEASWKKGDEQMLVHIIRNGQTGQDEQLLLVDR